MTDPRTIALNSVSGTNAYLSEVMEGGNHRTFVAASVNGTVNGTLQHWINNEPRALYDLNVCNAGGAKNNTQGWFRRSFNATDIPPGCTVNADGTITMDSLGGTTGGIIATPNAVGITLPMGPCRSRFRWVNVSGTGNFKADESKSGNG